MANESDQRHLQKKHTDVSDIAKNPVSRQKLESFLDEVVRCKIKIADEQESIRNLRESAVEELGINPKEFNLLVGVYFNHNGEAKRDELESSVDAIDAMFINTPLTGDEE